MVEDALSKDLEPIEAEAKATAQRMYPTSRHVALGSCSIFLETID